jgi:catechol 2,3-dioxygenase-like lactoylglutathione lyase family enzyme
MTVREFFHFMQIVDDFDDAEAKYKALLGLDVYAEKHWSDFDKRWASLAVVGPEFVLELMEPSKDEADRDSPLPKFWHRHGEHFHSLSWFYDNDELPAFIERLRAAGIRVIDPYPELDDPTRTKTIFTHPKDTFGQMEFQGIRVDSEDGFHRSAAHLDPEHTGAWWRDEFPLGLLGTSHITTIVDDLDRARTLWTDLLDGQVFHEETTADRSSMFVLVGGAVPGREIVVEVALPVPGESRIAIDQMQHGSMPHSLSLRVADLDAAATHVGNVGLSIIERSDDAFLIDPTELHNGVVYCTTRALRRRRGRSWLPGVVVIGLVQSLHDRAGDRRHHTRRGDEDLRLSPHQRGASPGRVVSDGRAEHQAGAQGHGVAAGDGRLLRDVALPLLPRRAVP